MKGKKLARMMSSKTLLVINCILIVWFSINVGVCLVEHKGISIIIYTSLVWVNVWNLSNVLKLMKLDSELLKLKEFNDILLKDMKEAEINFDQFRQLMSNDYSKIQ